MNQRTFTVKCIMICLCLLSLSIKLASSCKCRPYPKDATAEELTKDYREVFTAEILFTEEYKSKHTIDVLVKVSSVIKSDVDIKHDAILKLNTCNESACCGVNFKEGESYIIYLSDIDRNVGSCSPTKSLNSKQASEELSKLKKYFNISESS
mmetsp:Transcript_13689/g.14254  ORF Transcript_13689/g.14254 Transcript_13689/m.14254 type:complete len:152 (+) Transcript_13689:24-479(+)